MLETVQTNCSVKAHLFSHLKHFFFDIQDGALSPPLTEATRQKIDGILKSKGLTKSFEDLLSATANEDDSEENAFETGDEQLDENKQTTDTVSVSLQLNEDDSISDDSGLVEMQSETVNAPTSALVDVEITNDSEQPKPVVAEILITDVDASPQVDEIINDSQAAMESSQNETEHEPVKADFDEVETIETTTPHVPINVTGDNEPTADIASVDLLLNDNNNMNKTPISAWNAVENLNDSTEDTSKTACVVVESNETTENQGKEGDVLQPDLISTEIVADTDSVSEDKTLVLLPNGTPTVEV